MYDEVVTNVPHILMIEYLTAVHAMVEETLIEKRKKRIERRKTKKYRRETERRTRYEKPKEESRKHNFYQEQ